MSRDSFIQTRRSPNLLIAVTMAVCLFISTRVAGETSIKVNAASGAKAEYVISLVELAFEKLNKPLIIHRDQTKITQARISEEVKNNNLDVMWVSTSAEKESQFLPVRIPLLKGLLGYRIMLIRAGDQPRFDTIRTLKDLQTLKLGQGRTWADTPILKANNIEVITANKSPNLFSMLDGGRFDAFPRGASEPFAEIQKYSELNLAIEKNLVLAYKMPFYIFVNKDNHRLARDIEKGLNLAIADGSFDDIFYRNPTVIDALKKANLDKRRLIKLTNPTLPPNTPVYRDELWVSPSDLAQHP